MAKKIKKKVSGINVTTFKKKADREAELIKSGEVEHARVRKIKLKKRIFARYLAAGYSVADASTKTGIPAQRGAIWSRQEGVVRHTESLVDHHIKVDAETRRKRSQYIGTAVYDAIIEKIDKDDGLDKVGIKTLVKFHKDLGDEIRKDTPAPVPPPRHQAGEAAVGLDGLNLFMKQVADLLAGSNSARYMNGSTEKIIEMESPTAVGRPLVTKQRKSQLEETTEFPAGDSGEEEADVSEQH